MPSSDQKGFPAATQITNNNSATKLSAEFVDGEVKSEEIVVEKSEDEVKNSSTRSSVIYSDACNPIRYECNQLVQDVWE